jgi:hypothetical protein
MPPDPEIGVTEVYEMPDGWCVMWAELDGHDRCFYFLGPPTEERIVAVLDRAVTRFERHGTGWKDKHAPVRLSDLEENHPGRAGHERRHDHEGKRVKVKKHGR